MRWGLLQDRESTGHRSGGVQVKKEQVSPPGVWQPNPTTKIEADSVMILGSV